MAHVERFEDLIAWQKSQDLCVAIYKALRPLTDFSYRDQIQRAAVSIPNNIAEGFERHSSKEFIRFLSISKGSAGEVRSMIILGSRLGYFDDGEKDTFVSFCEEVSRILSALMHSLSK